MKRRTLIAGAAAAAAVLPVGGAGAQDPTKFDPNINGPASTGARPAEPAPVAMSELMTKINAHEKALGSLALGTLAYGNPDPKSNDPDLGRSLATIEGIFGGTIDKRGLSLEGVLPGDVKTITLPVIGSESGLLAVAVVRCDSVTGHNGTEDSFRMSFDVKGPADPARKSPMQPVAFGGPSSVAYDIGNMNLLDPGMGGDGRRNVVVTIPARNAAPPNSPNQTIKAGHELAPVPRG